jgi:probable HAF family extracellular repeat protein
MRQISVAQPMVLGMFVLIVLLPAHVTTAAVEYAVTAIATELGPYGGARDINDHGVVVGEVYINDTPRAYMFANGAATLIFGGSSPYSTAYGINESNQIVGDYKYAAAWHGFLYDRGAITTLMSVAGGTSGVMAYAINEDARIVGTSVSTDGHWVPAILSEDSATQLPTLGGPRGGANDINDAGDIVGLAEIPNGDPRAFLYRQGKMINLGTFGGTQSEAYAINNSGDVVGYATDTVGTKRGFLYDGGSLRDLGSLGGDTTAFDINDRGDVVGWSFGLDLSAFIWRDGVMRDLNSLVTLDDGWQTLYIAQAINNHGQIVGVGSRYGQTTSFLLTPIPAPGALALLVLSALCTSRRRRWPALTTNMVAAEPCGAALQRCGCQR